MSWKPLDNREYGPCQPFELRIRLIHLNQDANRRSSAFPMVCQLYPVYLSCDDNSRGIILSGEVVVFKAHADVHWPGVYPIDSPEVAAVLAACGGSIYTEEELPLSQSDTWLLADTLGTFNYLGELKYQLYCQDNEVIILDLLPKEVASAPAEQVTPSMAKCCAHQHEWSRSQVTLPQIGKPGGVIFRYCTRCGGLFPRWPVI